MVPKEDVIPWGKLENHASFFGQQNHAFSSPKKNGKPWMRADWVGTGLSIFCQSLAQN